MTIEDDLIEAMSRVALDDVMAMVVKRLSELRVVADTLEASDADALDRARALHQLSLGLQRLQRQVARLRDRKVAKLVRSKAYGAAEIARRTGIERTLVWKMAKRG